MEKIDTGGEEKKQSSQVKTADPAQQPFATALGSAAGDRYQSTLISHLPPFYHAMMATMERQLERITAIAIIAAPTAALQTRPALVEETCSVKAIPHSGLDGIRTRVID